MKFIAIAALAGLATASPMLEGRQSIDFDAYNAIPVVADVAAPLGDVQQATKVYNKESAATAAVVAATSAAAAQGGSAVTTGASSAVQKRAACDPRTSGVSYPDVDGKTEDGKTDTLFQQYPGFQTASAAANNVVPGFTTLVSGSNYAASDSTYMGYQMVKSYSPSQCAAACNSMSGCQSFNIYFERDPSQEPGPTCSNPSSYTYIKCAFFGGALMEGSMNNYGGYQADFHVVIAGSNLYRQTTPTDPPNFTLTSRGTFAPNAPGYMGVQTFPQTQPYDPSICAKACDAKSAFDIKQGLPSSTNPDVCNTFVAYMLYKNGGNGVFTCTYYNAAPADGTVARPGKTTYVNNGQYDQQGNHYTIGYSFSGQRNCDYRTNPTSCS